MKPRQPDSPRGIARCQYLLRAFGPGTMRDGNPNLGFHLGMEAFFFERAPGVEGDH